MTSSSRRFAIVALWLVIVSTNAMAEELTALGREALLANPLLDFDKLLLVQRGAKAPALGLPRNWQSNSSLRKTGYDDQIVTLSPINPNGKLTLVFKPSGWWRR